MMVDLFSWSNDRWSVSRILIALAGRQSFREGFDTCFEFISEACPLRSHEQINDESEPNNEKKMRNGAMG